MRQTLQDWLNYCEGLSPKKIVMGLERVGVVAQRMGLRWQSTVITVAGTNGKGSTCAMLESIFLQAGYRVGVYTSPHLVHFQERCRVMGQSADPQSLVPCFAQVEQARLAPEDGDPACAAVVLTYFEFTTLALLQFLSQSALDVVILEVGLGGRLDAVNIVDADCSVITSIDLDHTALLGSDRESIGKEKAGIMRAGKPVVISDPVPPHCLQAVAQTLGADVWQLGRDFSFSGDSLQWEWHTGPTRSAKRYAGLAYPALRGANQLLNAAGVLAVLVALRERLPVTAQAVRNGLSMVTLPGRFQIVPGQPVLVLDVAHNPHAVAALTANLDAMGFYPCTHAVFGAMADKDLTTMIKCIAPLVDRWYFTDLPTERACKGIDLQGVFQSLSYRPDVSSNVYADPNQALSAAMLAASAADRIVVFGSFFTVGAVLNSGLPKLGGQHA